MEKKDEDREKEEALLRRVIKFQSEYEIESEDDDSIIEIEETDEESS